MLRKTRPYREALLGSLTDPVEAAHYLNAAIDDSLEAFLKALRNVAQARQMKKVAQHAGVTRESLYRALSVEGNPTAETLHSVLRVVGLRIAVQPKVAEKAGATPPRAFREVFSSVPVKAAGRKRLHGRTELRSAGQMELQFPIPRAGAGGVSVPSPVSRNIGIAQGGVISTWMIDKDYAIQEDQPVAQFNQQSGGLAGFYIPLAQPSSFQHVLTQ